MARVILPFKRSLAYYRDGGPRFDPSHFMAGGITPANGFSGVSVGTTIIDLQVSQPGTILGAPTAKMYGATGLTTNYAGGTDATRFNNRSTTVNANNTYGVIFQIDAVNPITVNSLFAQSVTGSPFLVTGIVVGSSGGVLNGLYAIINGASVLIGSYAFQTGVPYFVATSYSTTNYSTVIVRLDTGQVTPLSGTGTFTSPASADGTYDIGNLPAFGATQLDGGIAAVMFSPNLHGMQQLQTWAQDPWSFWYPRAIDLAMMLPSVAQAAAAASRAGLMPMMGVG